MFYIFKEVTKIIYHKKKLWSRLSVLFSCIIISDLPGFLSGEKFGRVEIFNSKAAYPNFHIAFEEETFFVGKVGYFCTPLDFNFISIYFREFHVIIAKNGSVITSIYNSNGQPHHSLIFPHNHTDGYRHFFQATFSIHSPISVTVDAMRQHMPAGIQLHLADAQLFFFGGEALELEDEEESLIHNQTEDEAKEDYAGHNIFTDSDNARSLISPDEMLIHRREAGLITTDGESLILRICAIIYGITVQVHTIIRLPLNPFNRLKLLRRLALNFTKAVCQVSHFRVHESKTSLKISI